MQFIKSDINIDFIGKRKIAFGISIAMILISLISLIIHGGPRYGIDFAGGTLIQIKINAPVDIDDIKAGLRNIDLAKSSVQSFGDKMDNEYLVRTDQSVMTTKGFSRDLAQALGQATGKEAEIAILEKDNRIQSLRLARQSYIRRVAAAVLALAVVLTFVGYRRYRWTSATNALLEERAQLFGGERRARSAEERRRSRKAETGTAGTGPGACQQFQELAAGEIPLAHDSRFSTHFLDESGDTL